MKKRFTPQKDITAYELAVIVQRLKFGWVPLSAEDVTFDEGAWNELPEEIKRHCR